MIRIVFGFLVLAAYAAEEPSEVTHWTFADTQAAETKLTRDPKTATSNPALTNIVTSSGDIVRRTSFGKSGEAEIHENVTDVFCILTGQGEFLVGGKIAEARTTGPGEIRGPSIQGGVTKKFSAGDVLIIPPKTPHQILLPPGQRVTFLVAKMVK